MNFRVKNDKFREEYALAVTVIGWQESSLRQIMQKGDLKWKNL